MVSNRVGETRVRDNLDENGGDICSGKRRPGAKEVMMIELRRGFVVAAFYYS
jgi:hypothetical protein